jgi:putative modified peptide
MSNTVFSPQIVNTLLDKLGSDDQFREQFLGNPALTLHLMGVDINPAQVPAVRRLPSKAAIQANRGALAKQLEGQAGAFIFLVE